MGGMVVEKQRVAIVGAGNVGSILAKAFYGQGYPLTGIASRTLESAEKLAKLFNVMPTTRPAEIIQYADIVVIATPDRCIRQVVEEVAQDEGFRPGQVVLHTSGSLSAEVLHCAREQGAFVGCIHPLQSFADKERGGELLLETYFALGGDAQAIGVGEKIVQDFSGQSFILRDEDRPLYHAAACIASNYLVSLLHWSTQIYERIGLTPQQASNALMPLVQGTLGNIVKLGPMKALTGPVSRGDGDTVAIHLAALENKEEQQLYRELARYTVGVAMKKGGLTKRQGRAMTGILNDGMERLL